MSHSSCHNRFIERHVWCDRLISRFGPVNWPPRSCDLTPLDYFLWGYVKSLVYADKPQTLDHLEDNIRRVIADIRPQMLEKVIENWTSRLDYIRANRGSFPSQSRWETGDPSNSRWNPISYDRIPEKKLVDPKEDRTPVSCNGCGASGIIQSRYRTCVCVCATQFDKKMYTRISTLWTSSWAQRAFRYNNYKKLHKPKMAILGHGSMRDKRMAELGNLGNPKYAHLN
ncbi:hypothetical protein TNCV_1363541 [Trichonephila clavipes]|uniref:Transposase n=1 Tax=Trichonephila clavipes TaxID=2585209 RepID=A0A8X6S5M4_TRICX|nr:hypothetical protein TNCV_1363541 [Trichonephila clavipes]